MTVGSRHRTRWAAAGIAGLLVAAGLGACSSTDSGVDTGRASEHTGSSVDASQGTTDPSTAPATDPATDPSTEPATAPVSDPADGAAPDVGSGVSGVGDVLFPDLGNPGLDVDHYDIDVAYDHDTGEIDGTVELSITATEPLDHFTLDAVGLDVSGVEVDGDVAHYEVDDPELRIAPDVPIAKGASFEVTVSYTAEANPGNISAGVSAGWFRTESGSFVLDEPDGTRNWLPSNDHPSDKATYRFTIHVPAGLTGVANGDLVSHETAPDGSETWIWDEQQPMTTYLIQLMTGTLDVVDGTTPGGTPLTSVVQAGDQTLMQPFLDVTGEQVDYFEQYFGPYPFDRYGIAMTDGYIGGAMEEQGRSLFSAQDFAGGQLDHGTELLLSHELTHQWFGDGVSPAQWQDIWLNESFATYGEWMWLEHAGYGTITDFAATALAERQDGPFATGTPDVQGLFGFEVYEGGAVVLQALRDEVGDDHFFTILRTWVQDNLYESRTSADFIALSSTVAGVDLTSFFQDWLYATDLPDTFPS